MVTLRLRSSTLQAVRNALLALAVRTLQVVVSSGALPLRKCLWCLELAFPAGPSVSLIPRNVAERAESVEGPRTGTGIPLLSRKPTESFKS